MVDLVLLVIAAFASGGLGAYVLDLSGKRLRRIAPHEWIRIGAPGSNLFDRSQLVEEIEQQNLSGWLVATWGPEKSKDGTLITLAWIARVSAASAFVCLGFAIAVGVKLYG